MGARPRVLLSSAMSIDGYIDDTDEKRLVLSDESDWDRVDSLRAWADAILIGAGTLRSDNPVIDFTVAPTHEQVAAAHPDDIDAVLDLVTATGGDLSPIAGLLRTGATLVSTNYATDPATLAARDILGINLGNSPTAETLSALAELAASGELRVRIDAEVPLHEAPAAIASARTGHSTGKTVIVP